MQANVLQNVQVFIIKCSTFKHFFPLDSVEWMTCFSRASLLWKWNRSKWTQCRMQPRSFLTRRKMQTRAKPSQAKPKKKNKILWHNFWFMTAVQLFASNHAGVSILAPPASHLQEIQEGWTNKGVRALPQYLISSAISTQLPVHTHVQSKGHFTTLWAHE